VAGARSVGATAIVARVARRTREKGDTKADAILYDYGGLSALLSYLQTSKTSCSNGPVATGLPVWGPLVIGRVRKVDQPDDELFASAEHGRIMLLNNSSPDFVPLFYRAGAVLAEVGGYGSHAAQTAPLCDTPCVVGLGSLTDQLEDDDLVLVDAPRGLVYRLEGDG
jgi:pyruvate,water dikinase